MESYTVTYTQKCRFVDKKVHEISRFFVAPPCGFPLSVWCVSRTSLSTITSTLVYVMERLLEAWEESETEDVTLVDNH